MTKKCETESRPLPSAGAGEGGEGHAGDAESGRAGRSGFVLLAWVGCGVFVLAALVAAAGLGGQGRMGFELFPGAEGAGQVGLLVAGGAFLLSMIGAALSAAEALARGRGGAALLNGLAPLGVALASTAAAGVVYVLAHLACVFLDPRAFP
jgi:hypothetical protein